MTGNYCFLPKEAEATFLETKSISEWLKILEENDCHSSYFKFQIMDENDNVWRTSNGWFSFQKLDKLGELQVINPFLIKNEYRNWVTIFRMWKDDSAYKKFVELADLIELDLDIVLH